MRLLRTVAFTLLVLLGLGACSGSDDAGTADSSGGDDGAVEQAADADGAEGGGDGEESSREVVTTGSLTLVAADPSPAMDEVVRLVEGVGGRVEERTEQARTEGSEAYGWLTVRVPAAELTATIDAVERLGEVTDLSISSEDVTRRGRDLDARIAALQTSTERLLTLMAEAESNEALLAAEGALSQRQSELESLQSERAYLSEQVAMSSLHITVSADRPAQLEAGGFLGGLETGWNALVTFASGVLVVLGAVLPWLLVLGVPLALVAVVARRRRRATAEAAPAG